MRRRLTRLLKRLRGDAHTRQEADRVIRAMRDLQGVRSQAGFGSTTPIDRPQGMERLRGSEVRVALGKKIERPFAQPEPWFTPASIAWLNENLPPGLIGIEFGAGGSTPWWCERLARLYTVEANPSWAIAVLAHMRERPDLLTRWSFHFVNADWHRVPERVKGHWRDHVELLTPGVVAAMESDYLRFPYDDPDVVVVDGAVRAKTVESVARFASEARLPLVVVDNTESTNTSRTIDASFPDRFRRIDLPEFREELIPSHQDGWVTTILVDEVAFEKLGHERVR